MPKIDGRTALKAALLSRGLQRDPRSRDAYKLAHAGGSLPEMRVDFGKKAARLEEKFVGAWRGISETIYYGQVTEVFADQWAAWALARASGFSAGREPAAPRTEAQKKSLEKSRAKSAAERERTSGAGYYVTNGTTLGLGVKRAINHEAPFHSLGEAEEFAWKQYREYLSMRFQYLLPVKVIQSKSRQDAERDVGHTWWIDGKRTGPKVDPRQMALPGVRRSQESVRYVRIGMQLPGDFLHGKRSQHAALMETDTGWSVVEHEEGRITKVILDNASYKSASHVYQAVK